MRYPILYKQVMDHIFDPSQSQEHLIEKAKRFAFNIYDMNSDGYIEPSDLFTFM
jgi:Ca2+-binding EF-hand superfamily protein